jgi:translation elongation factor EF-G
MQAEEQGNAVLLEPWYKFVITVPSESIGRTMSDIQQRNGCFEPFELEGDMAVLKGDGPAACFMDYPVELASYTRGRGSGLFTMVGYRPCHNAEEVIKAFDYHSEQDLENPAGSVFCSHGAGYAVPWRDAAEKMHCQEIKKFYNN